MDEPQLSFIPATVDPEELQNFLSNLDIYLNKNPKNVENLKIILNYIEELNKNDEMKRNSLYIESIQSARVRFNKYLQTNILLDKVTLPDLPSLSDYEKALGSALKIRGGKSNKRRNSKKYRKSKKRKSKKRKSKKRKSRKFSKNEI